MIYSIIRSSRLAAPAQEVWEHATSLSSIQAELRPLLRMTWPRAANGIALDDPDVPLHEPLFPSWILLFGLFPVDRMDLTLTEVGPGHRFVEESRPTLLRSWRHERGVVPDGAGCVVTDSLQLQAPLFGGLVAWFVSLLFDHRHRRLRALFGAA